MDSISIRSVSAVVFAPDSPAPVRYAARELCRCLGNIFPFSPLCLEQQPQAEGFFILLELLPEGLTGGAFQWDADAEGVRLKSGTPQGIVYGAYALLEALGCRFLARDCEVFPAAPVSLPWGIHREAPSFAVRELFWREAMDGDFAVKLRLNSARSTITEEQGGKAMFYNFSHTFSQLVPPDIWFDSHPEFFSMVDGRRLKNRSQLCLTNPDVVNVCVEGVKKWARENPAYNIFSVAMNDWYQPCQCPACTAVDREEGSPAGAMIRFVNAVAEEVEKEFPHVMIHTFAYLYCRKPPRIVKPRHNVIVRLCSIECCFSHPIERCGVQTDGINVQGGASHPFHGEKEADNAFLQDLKGWSEICENLYIWDYTTNYANYLLPFPNLNVLSENLRAFRRFRVRGVFEQGNFSLGRSSALGPLKIYLLGKLLWDPGQSPDALIADFVTGYYGPAAVPMARYIDLWRAACGPEDHAGIYDAPDASYLTDDRLRQAEAYLKDALVFAQEEPYRSRVEREALSIRYARLTLLPLDTPGRDELIDAFARDARRLGISELFERRDLEGSFQVMKKSRFARNREEAKPISYPL